MTTQLQRLIARARGAADAAARRIEPLLAPRYAAGSGADATIRELRLEAGAPISSHVAPVTTLPQIAPPRGCATRERDAFPPYGAQAEAAPPGPRSAHAATQFQTLPASQEREERGRAHAPSAVVDVPIVERGIEHAHETREAAPGREPARPLPQRQDFVREVATQTLRERTVERAPISAAEPAATVSLSIGRIDVHAPPAPAAAPASPRRPAFRPGVSLDTFLRRGGDDR